MSLRQLGTDRLKLSLGLSQDFGLLRDLGDLRACRLLRNGLQLCQRRLHIFQFGGFSRHLSFKGLTLRLDILELVLGLLQAQHGFLKLLLQAFPLTLQDFHLLLRHPQGLLGIRSLLIHLRQLALVQDLHILNAGQVFLLRFFKFDELIGTRSNRFL